MQQRSEAPRCCSRQVAVDGALGNPPSYAAVGWLERGARGGRVTHAWVRSRDSSLVACFRRAFAARLTLGFVRVTDR